MRWWVQGGVSRAGRARRWDREILGLWIEQRRGKVLADQVFNELRTGEVMDVLIAVVDGL